MSILSLEASTSSAKAMLYDLQRGVLGVESMPYPGEVSDVLTFSPDGVVDAVLACGAALLGKHPDEAVEAVGLSSIWHSLVLLDNGKKPVGRGYTWADTSPAPTTALYRKDAELARRVYQSTGCPLHSTYNVMKWIHLKRTQDVSAVCRLSSLPEFLFFALTGELATTNSAASGMGLLNTHTLDWDAGVLELMGIGRAALGRLVELGYSAKLAKAAAEKLGLPEGTPVAAAGPDGALNHIAAGGLGNPAMTLSVGTSGALRVAHSGPAIPERESTWCYYAAEARHIVGAATAGACNCVNWFVKGLMGGRQGYAELEAAAVASDKAAAPYFLPFLFGERCPGWDDSRLGGFTALCGAAGTGELYHAVLEGVLFNLYQNYQILVENIGFSPKLIGISGGITQAPYWMQMAADVFGAPLEENTGEHASLLGAAYVAAKASGQIAKLSGIAEARGRRHEPNAAGRAREMERFERWMDFYDEGSKL